MELNNLKPAKGSVSKSKRIARGQGSGRGGTATKGHKGAQSRSGYKSRAWFEGGQMPLQRRTPKRGFKNINRVDYKVINLDKLQELVDKYKFKTVDVETLRESNLMARTDKLKILGRGELKAKIDVSAHAFSEVAKKAIEANGGKTTEL